MSARVKQREDGKEWMVGVVGGNDRASVKARLHKTWGASAGEGVRWINSVTGAWVKLCERRKEWMVQAVGGGKIGRFRGIRSSLLAENLRLGQYDCSL